MSACCLFCMVLELVVLHGWNGACAGRVGIDFSAFAKSSISSGRRASHLVDIHSTKWRLNGFVHYLLQEEVRRAAVSGNLDAPEGTNRLNYCCDRVLSHGFVCFSTLQVDSMQSCRRLCAAIKSDGGIRPVVCWSSPPTRVSITLATAK